MLVILGNENRQTCLTYGFFRLLNLNQNSIKKKIQRLLLNDSDMKYECATMTS